MKSEKNFRTRAAKRLLSLFLAVAFSGCQAIKTDLSTKIANLINPSLLLLKILTAEVRIKEGQWPAAEADFQRVFGDSVSTFFQDKELVFRNQYDTLTISYSLLNKDITEGAYIEFTGELSDGQIRSDTARFHIKSHYQQADNTKRFRANQGSITFYQNTDKSISVKHSYAHGFAQTTIKLNP